MDFSHHRKCFACNIEHSLDDLGYDIQDLQTYCKEYDYCQHPKHPNSPENVQKRGTVKDLIPITSKLKIAASFRKLLGVELFKRLEKVLGKSIAVRVPPNLAMHIAKVAQKQDHTSVNQTMNYIIEKHFKDYPTQDEVLKDVNWELRQNTFHAARKPKPKPEPVVEVKQEEEEFTL